MSISKVFQEAIVSTKNDGNECLKFDFNKALDIAKKHEEMAVVGIINQTISQSSAQASVMTDKVMGLLEKIFTIALTDTQKKNYKDIISSAFTDLKNKARNRQRNVRSASLSYHYR